MLGLWLGFPLKFSATVPHQVGLKPDDYKIKRDRLDVTPLVAFGAGISPNAFISLLAGISLGRTNLPPSTDKDDEIIVSFLFGLGGNLDLVGLLTKK